MPPIPATTVMDGGRYLSMPIPTMKHDNVNEYERILTADHESRRKICTISYITNSLLISKRKKKERRTDTSWQGTITKRKEKKRLRKPSYNTEKDSESFLSPPHDFSHFGVSHKKSLSMSICWLDLYICITLDRPLLAYGVRSIIRTIT